MGGRQGRFGLVFTDESDNQPELRQLPDRRAAAGQRRLRQSEALSQASVRQPVGAVRPAVYRAGRLAPAAVPVIDDYHLITNDAIHEAMRFFLRHQPENLTLILLSRTLPPLGIANLRVRDQLLEMGTQQLAFTHQEAKQFFDCRTAPMEQQDRQPPVRRSRRLGHRAAADRAVGPSVRLVGPAVGQAHGGAERQSPVRLRWTKCWITSMPMRAPSCCAVRCCAR